MRSRHSLVLFSSHFGGKGLSGATVRSVGYQLDRQLDLAHPTFDPGTLKILAWPELGLANWGCN